MRCCAKAVETLCRKAAHVHGCLLQDFFFSAGFGSQENQGKYRRIHPHRAAKSGLDRDAEQQDLNRHLVVMGWTGIAGSPRLMLPCSHILSPFTWEEGYRHIFGELTALPRKGRSDLAVQKSHRAQKPRNNRKRRGGRGKEDENERMIKGDVNQGTEPARRTTPRASRKKWRMGWTSDSWKI